MSARSTPTPVRVALSTTGIAIAFCASAAPALAGAADVATGLAERTATVSADVAGTTGEPTSPTRPAPPVRTPQPVVATDTAPPEPAASAPGLPTGAVTPRPAAAQEVMERTIGRSATTVTDTAGQVEGTLAAAPPVDPARTLESVADRIAQASAAPGVGDRVAAPAVLASEILRAVPLEAGGGPADALPAPDVVLQRLGVTAALLSAPALAAPVSPPWMTPISPTPISPAGLDDGRTIVDAPTALRPVASGEAAGEARSHGAALDGSSRSTAVSIATATAYGWSPSVVASGEGRPPERQPEPPARTPPVGSTGTASAAGGLAPAAMLGLLLLASLTPMVLRSLHRLPVLAPPAPFTALLERPG